MMKSAVAGSCLKTVGQALCLALLFCSLPLFGDMLFENPLLKLKLGSDGRLLSLQHMPAGRECLADDWKQALAAVVVDGKRHAVNQAGLTSEGLVLTFKGCDTSLTVEIKIEDKWLRFTLKSIRGTRPSEVELLRIPVGIKGTVARKLNAVYDETSMVCVLAASRHPDCGVRGRKQVYLSARAQDAPGPKLEGASVALIVCPSSHFPLIAREASHAFGMLTNETGEGLPVKQSAAVRGSYYFIAFGEKDVERMIADCRRAGIRQVMLNSGAWCRKVGHYEINTHNFPNGLPGLKATVARLHEAGILVGMHCFASKISKSDRYVTPVPDRRFWVKLRTRLAAGITADQTEIRVEGDLREWPGCELTAKRYWEGGVQKHREVIFDDEIIQFESIGPEGVWNTFLGCRRGAWGTRAGAHPAGTEGRHYGVDGCINGYIIDQETSLLDEAQERLAHIFNSCDFDMVYFDGGEDVDRRRYRYYVSKFQENAMRKFKKRPIIHMGTAMTQRLWHSFARSATVDTYLNTLSGAIVGGRSPEKWPTVRGHIDRSVAYMLRCRADLMPGELGWFGIWGRREFHGRKVEGLQLDELEYLTVKSLAYNVPISLQTSFKNMDFHPLTPEILRIFRAYEELRLAGSISVAEREVLKEKGADFALVRDEGKTSFVRLEGERFHPGGNPDVYALVGGWRGGSLATVWHAVRDGHITLAKPVRVRDFAGNPVLVAPHEKGVRLEVGVRRLTLFSPLSPAAFRRELEQAEVVSRSPEMILLRPEQAMRMVGAVQLGSKVGIHEDGAHGDVLVCLGQANYREPREWYAEYEVEIPRSGLWTVWGRVRYPRGSDDSFGFVPEGEKPMLQGAQILGNCGKNGKKWHWTGRGGGSTSLPPGKPILLRLEKGTFKFRIYGRESSGSVELTPRLDLLLLAEGAQTCPDDALLEKLLDQRE